MTGSIRAKLLLIVCLTFCFSTAAILYFGILTTKRVIISENEKTYATQLAVILNILQSRHNRLSKSGMEGLFAEGYKNSTATELGALYYSGDPVIYPFIIDSAGGVVLHPRLAPGSKALTNEPFARTMLLTKSGTQHYRYQGEDKWMVYRTFEPWQWTVAYAIKSSDKFSAVKAVANATWAIMVVSSLISLSLIAVILSRIIGPLRVLAEDARIIGDGNYAHAVADVKGHGEITQLATSLRTMVSNIRMRDVKIRKFNEQLEQNVRERTADLEASEERFRDVALSSADWIWEIDSTGQYTFSSGRVQQILGYSHEEVLGKSIYNQVSPDDASRMREVFGVSAKQKSAIVNLESWHQTKTGDRVYLLTNGVPVLGKNDQLRGYRGVHQDITQRKQYEEELKGAKEVAEEASRMKSEFLANMSHEIRTPMNGIMGMTGLLAHTALTQEQHDFTQTIKNSADALLSIINDILDFSKIEAGKLDFEFINFDLHTCIEDITEILAIKANEKDLSFGAIIQPSVPPFLKGDPGRLRQVLMNICSNAIKFTHQGQIVIRVLAEEVTDTQAKLRFSITDTGVGIPADRKAILFDPFTQVDASTTRKYGGTGLGLAISKQLVEMMHGQIGVDSAEERGSTFWFTAVFERQSESDSRVMVLPEDIKGKRVLVVDDNAVNCEILVAYLNSWECRCSQTASAPDALLLMHKAVHTQAPYDLAIIDHMMPGMSGEELAIAIKANPDFGPTKLVMLASRGLRGDAQMAKKSGYDAYLTKPVRRRHLYNAILALFSEDAVPQAGLRHGDLITRHSLNENEKIEAHVLVVEDNITNQKVAKHILEILGCRTDAVANGHEAVEAVSTISYDIIFMDVQMPVMDGLNATKKIRRLESRNLLDQSLKSRRIPIVAMTANAMKGDREQCLEAGMDDYLAKPVDPEAIKAKLIQWLPSKSEHMVHNSHQAHGPSTVLNDGIVEPSLQVNGRETISSPLPRDQQIHVNESASTESGLSLNDKAAYFDLPGALKRAMGDAPFLKMMLAEFGKQKELYLSKIQKAVEAGDADTIKMEAHGLKGAAGNLGLTSIQKAAFDLEKIGAAADWDNTEDAVARLQTYCNLLRDHLDSIDWDTIGD